MQGPDAAITNGGDRPTVTVVLTGEVDLLVREEIHALLDAAVDAAAADGAVLAVDLAAVTFMDSSGISCLAQAHRRLLEHGGRLRITGPQPRVRQVLAMTGFEHLCDPEA